MTSPTHRNVDVVLRVFADWNRGARDFDLDEIADDVRIHAKLGMRREPYVGRAGLREWVAEIEDSFGRFELHPDEVSSGPDHVLVLGRASMAGSQSGVPLEQPIGWVVDFRDGLLVELRIHLSHDEARADAARLSD